VAKKKAVKKVAKKAPAAKKVAKKKPAKKKAAKKPAAKSAQSRAIKALLSEPVVEEEKQLPPAEALAVLSELVPRRPSEE